MKNIIFISLINALFLTQISSQSFMSGQMDVEHDNNATAPVLSIKNNFSSAFTSSNVSIFNNLNYRLDLGVRSSTFGDGANHSFIQSWNNKPLDIYTGAERRFSIDSLGRVDFIGDDMLEDTIIRVSTDFNGKKDVVGVSSIIYPDGENENWGAGGVFHGGWRGIRAVSNVGVGLEAISNSSNGVFAASSSGNAIFSFSTSGFGHQSASADTFGIFATSSKEHAIVGRSSTANKAGIYGYSDDASGYGVFGVSNFTSAVRGEAQGGSGVFGQSVGGTGVVGTSTDGFGVDAMSTHNHGIIAASQNALKYDFKANGPGMDFGAGSSRRWKSNIENIANPLELISKLRGVRYDWDEEHGGGRHDIGFIAEEVGSVLPEIVTYEENGVDAIAMDYTKLPALLVEAFNTLKSQYDQQLALMQKEIATLHSMINELTTNSQN
jgi:hypothetical protein